MRLYESLSYLNNNNNNNNNHHANDNIDFLSGNFQLDTNNSSINSSTVKTFTSNGNQQSNSDSDLVESSKTLAQPRHSYFEISESIGSDVLSSQHNWPLEADVGRAFSSLNDTFCFYGSHRKLKSRENLHFNDDDNANGNDVLSNEKSSKDCVDLIDDSSPDLEAEINRLINRGNLCRQNFEHESYKVIAPDTEEQCMDEEEEFSSLSISASLSVEKAPYPKGIINPNYPGFQHLAHTLSEDFVDAHGNQTGSMSDSDFSEVDSDFPSEGHSTENNGTFACDDSNGNNIIVENEMVKPKDNLSTVEEILRTVFESNSSLLTSAIEMFSEKELQHEPTDTDSMDESNETNDVNACDLKTYLKHYDNVGIKIENVKPFTKAATIASPVNEPDVIRKSNSCERGFEQNVDKPDILLDVADGSVSTSNGEKEEPGSAWSITPVDIVGNFELEVERELGLRGFKNSTFRNGSDEIDGIDITSPQSNEKFLNKTADAILSTTGDKISMTETLVSSNLMLLCNDEFSGKSSIPTAVVKPKYQKPTYDDRQLPTVAHMIDDKIAWYDKSHLITTDSMSKCSAPAIPTHPKKIQLPELDRKTKKQMKAMSSAKSAHNNHVEIAAHNNQTANTDNTADGKETVCRTVTNSRSAVKSKTSGASVAVVQPRKKERMDERKLMETIVQMQIKKNALLYRGQGNNNKPITTTTSLKQPPVNHLNINRNGNKKYLNYYNNVNNSNNNNNNNNNGENYIHSMSNQAKKDPKETSGCFDVYNIETALPVIDMETIENHLKLVKEDERRKRNDREEIRRRLAMGAEDDYLTKISTAKPGRKPSLQSRLQEGKNLQICFVNDAAAAADVDSLSSDSESCPKLSKPIIHTNQSTNSINRLSNTTPQPNPYNSRPLSMKKTASQEKSRTSALTLDALKTDEDPQAIDFFTKQARLQIEARMALAQAKDIAHMQMEMERQKQMESPITGMIRNTIEKVGYHFPAEKRRVSRQMLTDMNVAQLQIIVNDFHTQIESLNEQLVKYLMDRDDLHMSQDSMLVDIEDLTRYLGAKKDPYSERKKPTKKYHSMKSPKYMVSQKIQPQHRLASQIGKS